MPAKLFLRVLYIFKHSIFNQQVNKQIHSYMVFKKFYIGNKYIIKLTYKQYEKNININLKKIRKMSTNISFKYYKFFGFLLKIILFIHNSNNSNINQQFSNFILEHSNLPNQNYCFLFTKMLLQNVQYWLDQHNSISNTNKNF